MKLEQKTSNVTRGQILESILIKETRVYLNFETQTSKLGRPFRLSGIGKNLQLPEKWIDKCFKNHWVYIFRYLDAQSEFFAVEYDYNNKFVKLEKL